ncbi:MAG: conjugal transfer protein TraN [Thiothrix sp.]|uniref:conjugal transfer protein TraN n=1 Tax=Thiothrix sp. TaxID=1032 RepID=UPI00261A5EEF|nr:conjugal transfer protein TraN [Thiothrix sp.]MDD5394865.1 conjugal transfer protein TraN [Thiothrix sp.]
MTVYGRVATSRTFALKLAALALVLWLVLALQSAWAEGMTQAQALDAGKLMGSSGASIALPAVDANTLPGFTTASPPETAYQSAGIGLEDTARSHLLVASPDSPEGSTFNSITTRPTFSLDREDPLVKHTDNLITDAENNPGTGTGTACKTLTIKDPPVVGTDTCMEYLKAVDNTCKRTLGVACAGWGNPTCTNPGSVSASGFYWSSSLPAASISNRMVGANLVIRASGGEGAAAYFTISNYSNIKSIKVTAQAGLAYSYGSWNMYFQRPPGGGGYYSVVPNGSDIKSTLYSYPRVTMDFAGSGWVDFTVEFNSPSCTYACTSWQDTWTNGCGAYATNPLCEAKSSTCTNSNNPRIVDGVAVTRTCWEYTDTYQCYNDTGSKGEDDYCAELRAAGCTQSSSTCNDSVYGRCVAWEQAYQCSVPGKDRTVEDCSAANYCQDGNCFDGAYEANGDFGVAASNLAAAEAMAKDFDGSFNIFAGQGLTCKQMPFGFKNCCKNSGWGMSIKLTQCSADEKILGQKLAAGLCHYVGDYKDNSLFRNRYKSFCCFNSKLARIIHEQGRPYVPLGWGDAKNPVCRGFTPEELEKIDFSKIDFSEFFADALANADKAIKPGSSDLGNLIKDKVIRLLPK